MRQLQAANCTSSITKRMTTNIAKVSSIRCLTNANAVKNDNDHTLYCHCYFLLKSQNVELY